MSICTHFFSPFGSSLWMSAPWAGRQFLLESCWLKTTTVFHLAPTPGVAVTHDNPANRNCFAEAKLPVRRTFRCRPLQLLSIGTYYQRTAALCPPSCGRSSDGRYFPKQPWHITWPKCCNPQKIFLSNWLILYYTID